MRIIRKVIGTLLLITAILVTQIPVVQLSATSSSDFQMDGSTLVKYIGTSSVVTIPDTVKAIGREAFVGNDAITEVKMGKNVKVIEQGAFQDCAYLSKVTLSDSVTTIGNGAFTNNASLKSFHITKNVSKIGNGVFAGCKLLSALSIDKNNGSFLIDENALYDKKKETLLCYLQGSNKTEFLMPNSVRYIEAYAFWGNDKLQQVALSNNLEEISSYAFSNCKRLSSLTVPYSVKNIDAKAFENCISLGMVEIPVSVNYIHATAFDGCPQLIIKADDPSVAYTYYQNWKSTNGRDSSIGSAVGDSLINAEGKVFVIGSDGQLVEVKSEDSETSVTAGTDIPAIHDPSNVDYIPASDPLLEEEEGILGKTMIVGQNATVLIDPLRPVVNQLSNRAVSIEEEKAAEERVVENEKGSALPKYAIINEKITDYAYYKDGEMTAYAIPANIESIGDFAFARSGLESINIPNGVKTIGYAAFYHCDNLNEISIPASVTWIEPSAFAYSAWLNNWANNPQASDFLVVGDGILIAYKGQESYVVIPEEVETIAPGCFIGREEITGIKIPDTVTIIGEEAFQDCINLTAIHGGSFVKKIGDRAFANTNLQEVTIGEYVEEIGLGAFSCEGNQGRKVTFLGEKLPIITHTENTAKIGHKNAQMPVFAGNWTGIIKNEDILLKGTVLEDTGLGLMGKIVTVDPAGNQKNVAVYTQKSSSKNEITVSSMVSQWNSNEIQVEVGHSGEYICKISEKAKDEVLPAFQRVYGKIEPEMMVLDIQLFDPANIVSYKQFGSTPLTITLPLPKNISGNTVHVAALDGDGQLEKLSSELISEGENHKIRFSTNHLSTFAIYAMGEDGSIQIDNGVVLNRISTQKDYTPNTGDNSIHPKWFVALAIFSLSIAFFAYRPRRKY